MNFAVSSTGSYLENVKSSAPSSVTQDKQAPQKSFAQIQASLPATNSATGSAVGLSATGVADNSQVSNEETGFRAADQLLMQSKMAIAQGEDPKATTDSSRTSQQSVTATTRNVSQESIAAHQAEDQLLMQMRSSIQQSSDPKWTADGSKVSVDAADTSEANTAQSTATAPMTSSVATQSSRDRINSLNTTDSSPTQLSNEKVFTKSDSNTSSLKVSLEKLALDQTYGAFRANTNVNGFTGSDFMA